MAGDGEEYVVERWLFDLHGIDFDLGFVERADDRSNCARTERRADSEPACGAIANRSMDREQLACVLTLPLVDQLDV